MDKLYKLLILIFLVILSISLMDIFALKSSLFGDYDNYITGQFNQNWWFLFRNIALLLIFGISFTYYLLYQDKSETISIAVGSLILWFTGLADLLYFWIQGKAVPLTLPHLNDHIIIGKISTLFGFSSVSNLSLYISVFIGILITFLTVKWLKNKI